MKNPKLGNKPKTWKQTQNSETKNRGVSVENQGVCVWNVRMWSIYKNPKLDNKPSWTSLVFYSLVHVYMHQTVETEWKEKYSNVLQTHIVIVGQMRILVFRFRYS